MSNHQLPSRMLLMVLTGALTFVSPSFAGMSEISLPGDHAYPESISATPEGTLYVSGLATGGVWRIRPEAGSVEQWIAPGAFGTRSLLGVLVDEKANLLWVCSNDFSSSGLPGPSSVQGSFIKGFDLTSGKGKVSAQLPGPKAICNDMVVGGDGSLYVTNSLAPQILRLKPGGNQLEVWLESAKFEQPPQAAPGLDGIAFGGDGNLYVDTFANGNFFLAQRHVREVVDHGLVPVQSDSTWNSRFIHLSSLISRFFRIETKDGSPGAITKLEPSRPLKFPDALRSTGGMTIVMAEGGGSVDRVAVDGDHVRFETIKGGVGGPTSVALAGNTLWISEGQLPHLFEAAKNGPPRLPFRIIGVPMPANGGPDHSAS